MKLDLGNLLATPGCLRFCEDHSIDLRSLIARHIRGDWGDCDPSDTRANNMALASGARILSVYKYPDGKIYLLTEAEDDEGVRACTTCLMANEY